MAMLVYASLHILGRQGYELLINQSIEKASRFADMINANQDFELITSPTLSLLTYRLVPEGILDILSHCNDKDREQILTLLNSLTVSVQKQQREAGKSFVSRTRLTTEHYPTEAITVFRVVLANPLTTEEDLSDILSEQLQIAKSTSQWQTLESLLLQHNKARSA
jgi:glutamate decarboxylase